jgi:two-component system, LuxR family, response regulator FixJ
MPEMDGLELMAGLRQEGVPLPVIVMTAQGDVQSAVRAMKAGAADFIENPFDDEVLLNAIQASLAPARPVPKPATPRMRRTSLRRSVRANGKFSTRSWRVGQTR